MMVLLQEPKRSNKNKTTTSFKRTTMHQHFRFFCFFHIKQKEINKISPTMNHGGCLKTMDAEHHGCLKLYPAQSERWCALKMLRDFDTAIGYWKKQPEGNPPWVKSPFRTPSAHTKPNNITRNRCTTDTQDENSIKLTEREAAREWTGEAETGRRSSEAKRRYGLSA